MTESTPPFLGAGWAFPPEFMIEGSSVAIVSGREDIEESLKILLSTLPGERVMQPDYGCDLTPLLFESLTTSLITDIGDRVRTAILYFEPRIMPEEVTVVPDDLLNGKVVINVSYRVSATNSRHNFVFPFYKQEGAA
jgi:uncharacterized protein